MALKYYSHIETLNINMNRNELQNAVAHPVTTATLPTGAVAGQFVYNATVQQIQVYDGANWVSAGGITEIITGSGLTGGSTGPIVTLNLDYTDTTNNVINAAPDKEGTAIGLDFSILVSSDSSPAAEKYLISDLPFSTSSGTVTSIAVTGNDGISVTGSPITTSGTIDLSLTDGSISNDKLENDSITIGSTEIALGQTETAIDGLTGLDFTAANASIAASLGANNLTIAGSTSTVVIPGNLTVTGTTTTVNSTNVNIGDNIITLNSNETGAPSQDAGIEIERGTEANVQFVWNETTDRWDFGTESVSANTFIGNLTGNADTADAWSTARTLTVDGDASGSVLLDGSSDVTLTLTIDSVEPDSITLGTDTTGNYIATATGSNGIIVTGSGSETADITITGVDATDSQPGVVELATDAEAIAGTATDLALTPASGAALVADKINESRATAVIPSGSSGLTTVTHNLNTNFIIVNYWDATTGEMLFINTIQTSTNAFDVELEISAPNDINVAIIAAA